MGTDTVKVQNLRVLKVVEDQNLLVVKGCVPQTTYIPSVEAIQAAASSS